MVTLDSGMATWNFFRREHEPELWCAVPANGAVPDFLLSGQWHFSGHQFGARQSPPGFNHDAAMVAERFNGFYLFQLTKPVDHYRPVGA